MTEMRNASAVLKSLIFRNDTLLVEAYVTFACIDNKGKPLRLPRELRKLRGLITGA